MNSTICEAINGQQVLELRYHNYSRIVEPHAYGRDKAGDEILRCYQTSGGSESGERTGWKILKVRDVFMPALTKENFTPRSDYRRGDKAMVYMFCQV